MTTPTAPSSARPHLAAVLEDRFYAAAGRLLGRLGWRPRLEAYGGYGSPEQVRVLARVLLARPRPGGEDHAARRTARRGFRHFLTVPAPGRRVRVEAGGRPVVATTDRGGYVDVEVRPETPWAPGWQRVALTGRDGLDGTDGSDGATYATHAPVLVVGAETRFGVVSDIDDTTMVTAVPRPLLAAWNTFVRHSGSRRPVDGMPELYQELERAHPTAPFVYLSTGAWNTAATLRAFLARNAYPAGPLLLTDWGPTLTGWFRKGQAHKDASLDLLMTWFPHVRWLLVGDDGQHDAEVYARAVARWPDRVEAVAIRQVATGRHTRAGELPVAVVTGRDGHELAARLTEVPGVLGP